MTATETSTAGLRPPARHGTFGEPPRGWHLGSSLADGLRQVHNVQQKAVSPRSIEIYIDAGRSPDPAPAPQEYPEPIKEYGAQWEWDQEARDYVREIDGVKYLYTDYQKTGGSLRSSERTVTRTSAPSPSESKRPAARHPSPPGPQARSPPRILPPPPPPPPAPSYEEPLGDAFQVVARPKRFFCPGRIFKAVWFEPDPSDVTTTPTGGGGGGGQRRSDLEHWQGRVPGFHGQKPAARFRWFVAVRRRPHHTLCFSITTFKGAGAAGGSPRGRPTDYVVLHRSTVEPARPHDEEGITRDPIAVIIEDEEQYISPIARLDCGRVYTVEDGLPVMKVGRVHPAYLDQLDAYYRESLL